jgi:hypothetical protein
MSPPSRAFKHFFRQTTFRLTTASAAFPSAHNVPSNKGAIMTGPVQPHISHLVRLPNSRTDSGTIEMNPSELTKAGAISVAGGVLTVKNEQLASLIHSKLADAAKMVPNGKVASDVDVSVGVKIK